MVVLRVDGNRLRGYSQDFFPGKSVFRLHEVDPSGATVGSHAIRLDDVHAVFFVRDFGFERKRRYTAETTPRVIAEPPADGAQRLRVTCAWGEVMEGVSYRYEPEKVGFFLFPTRPLERAYNLERAWLTPRAVERVESTAA